MEEKKITIVIPVYNAEKYIGRCLNSILEQTINNFKILIIDDGSTDDSQEVIQEYKKKYPGLIELIVQENIGVAKTRNKAIKIVKTEYIMFIDNDDYVEKDYVEILYNCIEKEELDVVLSGYKRVDNEKKVLRQIKLLNYEWSKLMVMAPWAKIYRIKYLQDNNIEFLDNNVGEDIYFNLLASFLSQKIKIIDYVGYNWFYNIESISNTIQKDITKVDVYKLLNSIYNTFKQNGILERNDPIIEAIFIRYIYLFVLYSTRGVSYKIISEEFDKLFEWLKEKFPNYKENKLIGHNIKRPYGESFYNRILYIVFNISNNLGLGKIFIYLYNEAKEMFDKKV